MPGHLKKTLNFTGKAIRGRACESKQLLGSCHCNVHQSALKALLVSLSTAPSGRNGIMSARITSTARHCKPLAECMVVIRTPDGFRKPHSCHPASKQLHAGKSVLPTL